MQAGRMNGRIMHAPIISVLTVLTAIMTVYTPSVFAEDNAKVYGAYLKGLMAEKYDDSEKAVKEFTKAGHSSTSPTLDLKLAVSYIKTGADAKASEILSSMSDADVTNTDAYLLLILMYSAKGESEKANKLYAEMTEKMYAKDKGNEKLAESLAQIRFHEKKFDEALAIYKDLSTRKPDNQDALFWLGYLYEETGKRDKAVGTWEALLRINPQHGDALNSLGYVFAEKGIALQKAEEYILAALKQKPDSPAYLDSLGWVCFKQGRLEEARAHIEKAVSILKDPVIQEHLTTVLENIRKNSHVDPAGKSGGAEEKSR